VIWAIVALFLSGFGYWLLNRYEVIAPVTPAKPSPVVEAPVLPAGMVLVEGGKFMMGSNVKGEEDAAPRHEVAVSTFLLGDHEVTNQEYADFLNKYGSDRIQANDYAGELLLETHPLGLIKVNNLWIPGPGREEYPVVNVTWFGAWLYAQQKGGRLPSEAEWEYAARGGPKSGGYRFSGDNDYNNIAWNEANSKGETHPVKQKKPNELGIYDLNGNVYEWCQDWFGENVYKSATSKDPKGATNGESRIMRGGSWSVPAQSITYRDYDAPTRKTDGLGFRVAMDYKTK
jgi:formylglycine-generating enzyme required for sulfatase activity